MSRRWVRVFWAETTSCETGPARSSTTFAGSYMYMEIYTYMDIWICIYVYIQASDDIKILWWCCDVMSSRVFNLFWKFVQPSHGWWWSGVDFFPSAVIEILTKECPLCKKQSVPFTLYHCITALCRAGNLDRGLFKPELSRLLQLYNKTGLSSMDFVPFKYLFAFRKHLTLVKRLSQFLALYQKLRLH